MVFANSSDVVGKYFMIPLVLHGWHIFHIYLAEKDIMKMALVVCTCIHHGGDNKKLDFPRGYHIEYWGGMGQPAYGFGCGIESLNGKYPVNGEQKEAGGYGKSLKEDYRLFLWSRCWHGRPWRSGCQRR